MVGEDHKPAPRRFRAELCANEPPVVIATHPRLRLSPTAAAVRSTRSIASSITFTDLGTDYGGDDEDLTMIVDGDPFFEASFGHSLDHQPGMPRRRNSQVSRSGEGNGDGDGGVSVIDQNDETTLPPTDPSSPMRASTDTPPARPVRQFSVGTNSQAEGMVDIRTFRDHSAGSKSAQPPMIPTRKMSLASNGNDGAHLQNFFSSSPSSTEPVLAYLMQQPLTEEMIHSTLRELNEKAKLFKSIVDIQDRKYGMRTFPQCFVGSQAVDRMIEAGLADSRCDAVELGRDFCKYLGLFCHVCQDHVFKDKFLFYRFCDNDNCGSSTSSSSNPAGAPTASSDAHTKQRRNILRGAAGIKQKNPWYASKQDRQTTIIAEEDVVDEDADRSSPIP